MSAAISTAVLNGATGFLGSAVLSELQRRKFRPLVLTRPESDLRKLASVPALDLFVSRQPERRELVAKIADQHPKVFIHCAWRGVAGVERNADFQISENVKLTRDSVELAAACGCEQWIGLGSQAEYGNANRVLDETAPTNPTTLYGKAKLLAGTEALSLCNHKGIVGAWLRVFSTYGPGDHPHWMIPYVIREFLSGRAPQVTKCEQQWDYLFVEDAARAIVSVAEAQAAGVFNLGSGDARPLKQIIELIRRELNTPVQPAYGAIAYRPDQVMHLQANINKLRAASGWQPQIGLDQGIRATVDWEKKLFNDPSLPYNSAI